MDVTQFNRIAKALADPRRFEILEIIAAGGTEMCCGEVVCKFTVSQATVSHHLKELADAGLVETRTEGQFKLLRARPEVLAEYLRQVESRIGLKRNSRAESNSETPRKRTQRQA